MRTREEQISHLSCAIFNQHDNIDECIALARKYIFEAEARGIAAIKSSTKTAQEDERPDIRKWQEDQKEWFDPTIREIVAEYAAWRDQQDHSQALKQESLSDEAEQRVRAEISERVSALFDSYGVHDRPCKQFVLDAIDAAREVG
ncbi:hypothetical protein JK165_11170 [Acetobacter okinawensis]|uniref:hypothetical protein n=1 Tax=Acetobacter okinawensis TaxID=1076594 RepID=UPI001BACE346|nr:hypothetical protein [Acetobacter okinawensis]MBS0966639.1 hypothetical protein [Acetobacter okinawensis]